MLDVGLLLGALAFAAEKHTAQRRKDAERSPYINHPIVVAHLLWNVGGVRDTTILIAGILHDTVEDTDTTPAEIEERFGAAVRAVVEEVTDDKSLAKATRKQLQVDRAAHKSEAARHVKLADKISNLRDMHDSPPADWSLERKREYVAWACAVVDQMRGTNAGLEAEFDAVHAACVKTFGA